ncbi:MAG: hypothetical protein ACOCXQ_03855 [Patescibacteria group bacterium]
MDGYTPDISGFSGVDASSQGGVSTASYQGPLNQIQPATLHEDDTGQKEKIKRRILFGVIIGLFAISAIISISIYMYANSQSAAASTSPTLPVPNSTEGSARVPQQGNPPPGGELNGGFPEPTEVILPTSSQTQGGFRPQLSPTIMELLPSETPIPTVTPSPIPTLPKNPATQTPVPRPTREPWMLETEKQVYSLSQTSGGGCQIDENGATQCWAQPPPGFDSGAQGSSVQVNGTVYASVRDDDIICIDREETYMAKKKSDAKVIRLCDYFDEVSKTPQCLRYMPGGVSVNASIVSDAEPYEKCEDGSGPSAGTYVMRTKVHYNCTRASIETCRDSKEIFSDELRLQ